MKLTISAEIKTIVLGQYDPVDIWPTRVVYIDDIEVPATLSYIILLGLDTAMEGYIDDIEERMRKEGHSIL